MMVFHWNLSDSKSPKISRTHLSNLADFNNAIVGIVFTRSLRFKVSSPCANHSLTVPSAPVAIGITVTFMFHYHYYYLESWVLRYTNWIFFSFLYFNIRSNRWLRHLFYSEKVIKAIFLFKVWSVLRFCKQRKCCGVFLYIYIYICQTLDHE